MVIKAIIFDCFGVLVNPGHKLLYQDYKQFTPQLTSLQLQSDLGRMTRQQSDDSAAELIGLPVDQIEEQYWDINRIDQTVVDWAHELKDAGEYKIAMLSNIGVDWMDVFLPFFEKENLFDEVVLSGNVGLVKPDPAIFKLTADKLGLQPSECVMIDDRQNNIDGAKAAGMQGIVFVSRDQAQAELQKLLETASA